MPFTNWFKELVHPRLEKHLLVWNVPLTNRQQLAGSECPDLAVGSEPSRMNVAILPCDQFLEQQDDDAFLG